MAKAALFGVIGALLGGAVDEFRGFLIGLAIGIGLGRLSTLARRLEALERSLHDLDFKLREVDAFSRAAARARPTLTVVEETTVTIEERPQPVTPSREVPPLPPEPESPVDDAARPGPADTDEPVPPPPAFPSPDEAWSAVPRWVVEFFTTGNVVAKVGIVILFFGAAFLVRYAADRGLLPIEFRLMGLVVGALVLLVVGWKLRHTRPSYATALQGGAVGLLYLTIFAAFRLYSLLPALLTFALLLLVVAFSAVLAVVQNEKLLAVLGSMGGFLAPILASTGSGDHVGLFSYYLILNAGIVAIAWFRAWRVLNWLGFMFTFGVGFLWGAQFYQPTLFRTTEPFLIVFFAFYLAVAVMFAQRQSPQLRGYVDGSLVFGLPAIAFSMQSVLVREIPFGRAYSSVALSAVYLVLAGVLKRRAELRMLTDAFIALGVVFLILAVPFAFDGHGTAAAWALEGAGLVWIGIRQGRVLARAAGAILLVGAGVAFELIATDSVSALPIANSRFLGRIAIAMGSVAAAFHYSKLGDARRDWERPVEWILLTWGLIWWAAAAQSEIDRFVPFEYTMTSLLLVLAASGTLAAIVASRFSWVSLERATFAVLVLSWIWCVAAFIDGADRGPLANFEWIGWLATVTVSYALLRTFEPVWPARMSQAGHVGTAWTLWFLATWAAATLVADAIPDTPTWGQVAWSIVTSGLLVVLLFMGPKVAWPVQRHEALYAEVVPLLPGVFLIAWVLWACLQDGDAAPLPYLPVLNPLEIAQGGAILSTFAWCLAGQRAGFLPLDAIRVITATVAAAAFFALNAVVARVVHFYLGVPFDLEALIESPSFQAGISVLWALTALSLMTVASRRATRLLWIVGAGLLGALVIKLFIADLSQVGAIARIVSFLVTGVLILVIGYVAPVPPREPKVS